MLRNPPPVLRPPELLEGQTGMFRNHRMLRPSSISYGHALRNSAVALLSLACAQVLLCSRWAHFLCGDSTILRASFVVPPWEIKLARSSFEHAILYGAMVIGALLVFHYRERFPS